ncbi:hypothetical protein [Mycoplasma sp. Ms02]|uniref:hypothetical protein n=1 Tax=Mycoplasma sp. Ms02 TaxID=353851 RepID=UPI001C89CA06|nr:hypothetical protein [Mycoplasma sp. Ms02]QZE12167.1 hypothetical protein K4L35_02365 [Mycoplasma sp. Ms02]
MLKDFSKIKGIHKHDWVDIPKYGEYYDKLLEKDSIVWKNHPKLNHHKFLIIYLVLKNQDKFSHKVIKYLKSDILM